MRRSILPVVPRGCSTFTKSRDLVGLQSVDRLMSSTQWSSMLELSSQYRRRTMNRFANAQVTRIRMRYFARPRYRTFVIAPATFVLRRRGRTDDRSVHDRATAHLDALLVQMPIHRFELPPRACASPKGDGICTPSFHRTPAPDPSQCTRSYAWPPSGTGLPARPDPTN